MTRVRDRGSVFAGIFLVLTAGAGLYASKGLTIGSLTRMGPGYLPVAMCWILLVLGGILAFIGMVRPGEPEEGWHFRPLVLVVASLAYFACSVEYLGLVLGIAGLVLIASFADADSRRRELIPVAAALMLFCAVLFVELLGVPVPLWPAGIR